MSGLSYLLCVLTHGRSRDLARCLDSFRERVRPTPTSSLLWIDGPDLGDAFHCAWERKEFGWTFDGSSNQRGFCASTRGLWAAAAAADAPLIFWLEGDFEFVRDIDLEDLAGALDGDPMLAQMALCRDAANERERAAGGLVESRPSAFESMLAKPARPRHAYDARPWLRHSLWFSTNPSLMRRNFMRDNPFSEAESECEGKFGIELRERGYRFGLWGDGSVGVEHVGVRTGKGY